MKFNYKLCTLSLLGFVKHLVFCMFFLVREKLLFLSLNKNNELSEDESTNTFYIKRALLI